VTYVPSLHTCTSSCSESHTGLEKSTFFEKLFQIFDNYDLGRTSYGPFSMSHHFL